MNKEFIDKSYEGNLSREDIIYALNLSDSDDINQLFSISNDIRKKYCGDAVHIRALLEISNICRRNCNYCGVRKDNTHVSRYKMEEEEIIEIALKLNADSFKTLVMQGGESEAFSPETLARIVRTIKEKTDMAVTFSLGEHSYDDYKLWKEAGVDRFLLRHETANKELYKYLHPDGILDTRIEALNNLKELGYQTGVGCMVESPTQTIEQMADDIEFIRDFKPHMVGIGPYIMHEDTPFKSEKNGTREMTLKMLALARIVTKDALLPSTTALASIAKDGQKEGLLTGCDVVMINFTPAKYKYFYEIYPNKKCMTEDPKNIVKKVTDMIHSIGRTVATDHGHSRKIKK